MRKLARLPVLSAALLVVLTMSTACSQGTNTYSVDSSTPTGDARIHSDNIRYLCSHVGLLGADVVRWSCMYAKNVSSSGGGRSTTIRFNRMSDAEAKELALRPQVDWWQRFGLLVLLPALILVGWVQSTLESRKQHTSRDVVLDRAGS